MDADTLTEPSQVRVELGDRSYDILIGADLLAQAGAHVSRFLKQQAATRAVPVDRVYVNNFSDAGKPRALELPPDSALSRVPI